MPANNRRNASAAANLWKGEFPQDRRCIADSASRKKSVRDELIERLNRAIRAQADPFFLFHSGPAAAIASQVYAGVHVRASAADALDLSAFGFRNHA